MALAQQAVTLDDTLSVTQALEAGQRAVAMLSEIYNWFTEGFDTVDLKEAKVLLEER